MNEYINDKVKVKAQQIPREPKQRDAHRPINIVIWSLSFGLNIAVVRLVACALTPEQVLEKSRIKTIADVKRVSREIKILKRVRHPNVIALYEVLDTPSTIYFMMEHCDG